MSIKAMSLVWELPCPSAINGFEFKPGHKFVLLAYADHADQSGFNIYPSVMTVAKKTGYDERSIQRLTRELEEMLLLLNDGNGPRGTSRWFIPFSKGGDKISPPTKYQGDKSRESLGDIPSGDIPSGDILSPELKELNPENISIYNKAEDIWGDIKTKLRTGIPKASFETWVESTHAVDFDGRTLHIAAKNNYARDWLDNRITKKAQELSGYFIKFVIQNEKAAIEVE